MTKLFITGATGYIGGDALYTIANAYPDFEITALVRNSDKGARVASQYPRIRLVYGDLDSTDVLVEEASKADIVVNTASCDHVESAKALVAGLAKRDHGIGYLIHTSGTGMFCFPDYSIKVFGERNEKVYDDWDGLGEITSFADEAPHRNVDKIIFAASVDHPGKISTAIVAPPCISGPGRGPDNQKSIQAYWMAREALKRGKGFQVGNGQNRWTHVHVQDLSNAFLAVVTAALSPDGGKATWNAEGYYFTDGGEFFWGDVGRAIAKAAYERKLIKTSEIDSISNEEAEKLVNFGSFLWGLNSRARGIRAKKVLGWEPKQKGLFDLLPEIVEREAKDLGLIKGHAEEAST